MEQTISQKQKQQFLLAPNLQQSLRILQLPIMDLRTLMEAELEANPCLEVPDVVDLVAGADNNMQSPGSDDDSFFEQNYGQQEISLTEHLLRQMRLVFTTDKELEIGELIIGSLNENGYLALEPQEIARMAGADAASVGAVLEKIRFFDPVGCACCSVNECLLTQLKSKGEGGLLAYRIIESHLDDLANKRYALLAKKLGVSLDEVKAAVKEISLLEPNPARRFSNNDKPVYVIPDILVEKDNSGTYKVVVNGSELPELRISNFYRTLLNKDTLSDEEKEFIRINIQSGQDFIRGIKMRQETIRRITEYVTRMQHEFLEKGKKYLRPLSYKQAAAAIEKDETTVSRAVSDKYIDTPQGIFKLKDLFSASIKNGAHPEGVSSAGAKERIRVLVENEDKKSPLSDEDIVDKLKIEGISVSRRTIAKYRKELKILPSYLRKE